MKIYSIPKNPTILFILSGCILFSSCNSPHDKMVETMSKQSYCLEKATESDSAISVSNAQLHLKSDNSFFVSSDDKQLSEITGEWDLCCLGSDYGNYEFKIKGLPEWKQANTDFFVFRKGKKIRLFFKICN